MILFKQIVLIDERGRRPVPYLASDLPEIECLDEGSVLSRDKSMMEKGILRGSRMGIFSWLF